MPNIDPSDFDPMVFSVDVEVGQNIGDTAQGQVAINDRPFILERLTHQIVFNTLGQDQDGLYRLDWSLYQQRRFWKGSPPMADAVFGSVRHGRWQNLRSPITLTGNQTLHVTIENVVTRPNPFVVQVCFHGVEDLRQQRPGGA